MEQPLPRREKIIFFAEFGRFVKTIQESSSQGFQEYFL